MKTRLISTYFASEGRSTSRSEGRLWRWLGTLLVVIGCALSAVQAQVSGKVFQDFNANGAQGTTSSNTEPGYGGITVKAYNSAGTQVATATTAADGTYSLTGVTGAVRVEFTGLPSSYYSGPVGSQSNTSVQFVTGPATNVNLGINYPANYCQSNPNLATPCYLNGAASGTGDVLVSWPYNNSGATGTKTHLASQSEIGSTYGLAYDRTSKLLYSSSWLKRHVGLPDFNNDGKGDLGNIFVTNTATNTTTLWKDLTTLGINFGTIGNDASRGLTGISNPSNDPTSLLLVGKAGIGDIDLSDDGKTLYLTNLYDKKLYTIDVATKTLINSWAIPQSCSNNDVVNMGLKYYQGNLYIGQVCTAETSRRRTDLKATVYKFDGTTFTSALSFPLNYSRTTAYLDFCPGAWLPWENIFPSPCSGTTGFISNPQAMLADIEFDPVSGEMIIGLRDRSGDWTGHNNYGVSGTTIYSGVSSGDILAASYNPVSGSYTIENNGVVDGKQGGLNTSAGPGGGEFFRGDNLDSRHSEISNGGLAILPGSNEIALSAMDPTGPSSGGVKFLSLQNGNSTDGFELYNNRAAGTGTFNKANGLGDLEILCDPAPIEIGNRVWKDTNNNGIQDPGEPVLVGVTVDLCNAAGTVIASAITDANGNYLFSSATGTGTGSAKYGLALLSNVDYSLKISALGADSSVSGLSLVGITTAPGETAGSTNTGSTINNNDAFLVSGVPTVKLNTGPVGANNHTYDFGFISGTFDLALDKKLATTQASSVKPGDKVTFTITVYNQGTIAASNIQVSDYIPAGLVFNASDNPSWTSGSSTLATTTVAGPLAAGASTSINIVLQVAANFTGTSLVNKAEISSATGGTDIDSTPDQNVSNDAGGKENSGSDDALNGNGTGTPGGTDPATDEDDEDPALVNVTQCPTTTYQLCTNKPSYTLTAPATYTNIKWYKDGVVIAGATTADYAATQPGNYTFAGLNSATGCRDSICCPIVVTGCFDLALKKTLAAGQSTTIYPSSTVKFTVTIYNQGFINATNIQVSDYIPTGLTLNDANWSMSNGVATLNTPIASLAAGASTTRDISFTVNAGFTGSATNAAEISSATGGTDVDSTPDSNPSNDGTPKNDVTNENGKTGGDEDDHDPEVITVVPTPVFDLALKKTLAVGQSASVTPGSTVKFTITIYNQGNVNATAIQVSDYVPTGLTLNDANWSVSNGVATLNTPIASLAAGASTTRDITFTVNANFTGSAVNAAEISAATGGTDTDSTPDSNPSNDGTPKNDVTNENGKTGGDEDDHDPEEINVLCVKPILTTGNVVCNGTSYSVVFYSSVSNVTASEGTVGNGIITGIRFGNSVTITAMQATGCVSVATVAAPVSCPTKCVLPQLTAGQPICNGTTYSISFTATSGATITTSAGTVGTNVITGIPVGTDVTLTAIIDDANGCVSRVTVKTPTSCVDACENPGISISGPLCSSGTTYSVNYSLISGATLTSSAGVVSNGSVTGIPMGTAVTLTVNVPNCTAKTVVVPSPSACPVFDLALKKTLATGQSASVTPGSTVKFTITVYNQGTLDATAIQVSDYVPTGLTLNDANWNVSNGIATLKTPIASLAAGANTTVDISFTVNAGFTGSIKNVAEISAATGGTDIDSTPDQNPNNDGTPKNDVTNENGKNGGDEDDSDPEEITVTPTPVFDLALKKTLASGQSASVTPGSTVKFTITVYNQGNVNATAIQVSDYIPTGLTLNDANWNMSNGIATLKTPIASLAAGASTTRDISFMVNDGFTGLAVNKAEISAATGGTDVDSTPDQNPSNDAGGKENSGSDDSVNGNGTGTPGSTSASTDEDDEDPAVITVNVFDLALKKTLATGQSASVTPGSTVKFTITVYNQGTLDATAIQVSDYVPTGLTLNDANWNVSNGIATLKTPIASLAAGANTTVDISFTVNAGFTGSSKNVAEISAATGGTDIDSTPDQNPNNDGTPKNDVTNENGKNGGDEDDSDPEEITVLCVKPILTTGNVVCNDKSYSVVFYSSVSNVTASAGTVGNGIVTGIPVGTNVTITATQSSGCVSSLTVQGPAGCQTNPNCTMPSLIVGQPACEGNNTYTVSFYADHGTVTVSAGTISGNTVINIPINQDLTIWATDKTCISTSVVPRPANCSDPCENPSVSLSGPVCDNGTAYHLNYVLSPGATLLSSAGTVGNGVVTGLPIGTNVTLTVRKAGCVDKVVIFPPVYCGSSKVDLALKKLISKKQAKIGDVIDYTIKVWNESGTPATGVEVTDALNAGAQYISSSATRGSYNPSNSRWTIGSIGANGDTVTLTIRVKVLSQGVWFNTAEITKTNEEDTDSTPGNGTEGEDDIDHACFTVPIELCAGEKVQASVPLQYTDVKWYRNGSNTPIAAGNTVLFSEPGTYTYTSLNNACPAQGCCPIIIEAGTNCCPADLCIPFTIKKRKK